MWLPSGGGSGNGLLVGWKKGVHNRNTLCSRLKSMFYYSLYLIGISIRLGFIDILLEIIVF